MILPGSLHEGVCIEAHSRVYQIPWQARNDAEERAGRRQAERFGDSPLVSGAGVPATTGNQIGMIRSIQRSGQDGKRSVSATARLSAERASLPRPETSGLMKQKRGRTNRPPKVEIPGFEPGLEEPKSHVLPLHHTSVPFCKYSKYIRFYVMESYLRASRMRAS